MGRKSGRRRCWNWPAGWGHAHGKRRRTCYFCYQNNAVLSPQKNLTRSLNPDDWTRVDFHAPRVKVFSAFRGRAFVDPEIFQALALRCHGDSPFLPRLYDLCWVADKPVYSYISLFLGPRITKLWLGGKIPSPDVITSIKERCPFIQNLQIYRDLRVYQPDLIASVSDVLGQLSVIENLTCRFPLRPATIRHLSRLSTLKYMHLFDHPLAITNSLNVDSEISTSPFSHLTNLIIEGWDGLSLVQLLRILTLTHLGTLEIMLNVPSHFNEYGNHLSLSEYHPSVFKRYQPSTIDDLDLTLIFETLLDRCSHMLNSLSISECPRDYHSPISPPVVIRPLLHLTGLTHLKVRDIRGFYLDDAIVQEMASAWPSLQYLCTNNRHAEQPNVTLLGFSDLLQKCPQLTELSISIYASATDIAAVMAREPVPNMSIRTLDLGYSEAEEDVDPRKLVELLSDICPKLDCFLVVPKNRNREAWNFAKMQIDDRRVGHL
jgi:hypothetical protein